MKLERFLELNVVYLAAYEKAGFCSLSCSFIGASL